MALFGVHTKSCNLLDRDVVVKFVDDTAERLKSPNPYTNPFKGKVRKFVKKEIFIFDVEPLFFNFSVFGWFMAVAAFVFTGVSKWMIPGLLLGCFGVFWTPKFFYFICVKGLRKAGYNGPVVMLKKRDIIDRVIF